MIESKIYAQINNFMKTNHKTKIYIYVLPFYLWKPIGSLASHCFFVAVLFLYSMLFLSCFQFSQLIEGFLAIYLAPMPFASQNHTNKNLSSIFAQTVSSKCQIFNLLTITISMLPRMICNKSFNRHGYDIKNVKGICE